MSADPRTTHALDQIGALSKDVADVVTMYFKQYVAQGYPPELAHDFARSMEERLLGEVFRQTRKENP